MFLDVVLSALAAARLTRFLVTDDAGRWLVRTPARNWADRHRPPLPEPTEEEKAYADLIARRNLLPDAWAAEDRDLPEPPAARVYDPIEDGGWRARLVSGLDCPFCTSVWTSLAALAVSAALPDTGRTRAVYRTVTGALAASWVLGHVGAALGDVSTDYDD